MMSIDNSCETCVNLLSSACTVYGSEKRAILYKGTFLVDKEQELQPTYKNQPVFIRLLSVGVETVKRSFNN